MRSSLYFLFALMAWNAGYAQKNILPLSELCRSYGGGAPVYIIDGILIDADSIFGTTTPNKGMIFKNGQNSFTISPDDLEQIGAIKASARSTDQGPDKCKILMKTKKTQQGSRPLFLIDGNLVQTDAVTDPLKRIELHNISGITILKDANTTALYGARAANGVVVVTTKKP